MLMEEYGIKQGFLMSGCEEHKYGASNRDVVDGAARLAGRAVMCGLSIS